LDQADVVALEHNSAECLALGLCLDVVLFGIVKNQIHVLVKANDSALNPKVDVLEDPNTNTGAILKVSEDQVDGLNHH
jgi:hypothetical protein